MHGPQANTGGEPELDITIVVEATTAGELSAVPVDASDRHDMVCTSRKRQACQEPKNLTISLAGRAPYTSLSNLSHSHTSYSNPTAQP